MAMLFVDTWRFEEFANMLQIHFVLRGNDLVIHAHDGDRILESIPHEIFSGDFPRWFVEDHVHWLDLQKKCVYFRPRARPWEPSEKDWMLIFSQEHQSLMKCLDKYLVDNRDPVNEQVHHILKPLEFAQHIHTTISNDKVLEVELPRYCLKFFVNLMGELESRDLSAIIDPNQSCGTFVGLENRLMVRGTGTYSGQLLRRILVPFGSKIDATKENDHVKIWVYCGQETRLRYFDYAIDTKLWRLRGNGSLGSNLYQILLHAHTSSVMPDPLTGMTGTEMAIHFLSQVHLTTPPGQIEAELLASIKKLTPRRVFNSEHQQKAQSTFWHDALAPTTQHEDFELLVNKIYEHGLRISPLFTKPSIKALSKTDSQPDLISRARMKNSIFRGPDFGGNADFFREDKQYEPRDRGEWSVQGTESYRIASLIREWPSKFDVIENVSELINGLKVISGFGKPFNTSTYRDLLQTSLSTCWGSLLRLCRTSHHSDKFNLTFVFSTMAFGNINSGHLRILLAFAFLDELKSLPEPQKSFYDLTKGFRPDSKLLERIEECQSIPQSSGMLRRPKTPKLSRPAADQARAIYQSVINQWPCRQPSMPIITGEKFIRMDRASKVCGKLFSDWSDNVLFQEYLKVLEVRLRPLYEVRTHPIPSLAPEYPYEGERDHPKLPQLVDLLNKLQIDVSAPPNPLHFEAESAQVQWRREQAELRSIIATFESSQGVNRSQYAHDLRQTLHAYEHFSNVELGLELPFQPAEIEFERVSLEQHIGSMFDAICANLANDSEDWGILELCGLLPRITPLSLLSYLRHIRDLEVTTPVFQAILSYGEAISLL